MRKYTWLLILFSLIINGLYAQQSEIYDSHHHLFNEGMQLMRSQQYAAAHQKFEQFRQLTQNTTPKSKEAEYYAAYCNLKQEKEDGAVKIEAFAQKYPENKKAVYAYYELGNHYFNKKDYAKAIDYFGKVKFDQVERQKQFESRFKLGYAHLSKKNFDKALEHFNQIKNQNHQYRHASLYYAGYIAYKNKDYDEALSDLKQAGHNESYANKVPAMITVIYYKKGNYNQVISYGEKVINQNNNLKDQDEIYKLIAEAYFSKDNYKKSAAYFDKYKQAGGSFTPELHYRYGISLLQQDDYIKSIEHLKKVAQRNDTIGHYAAYNLGMAYLKVDNKPFAQNAFNQARKMEFVPEIRPNASLKYAKVSFEMENFSEVVNVCEDFLEKYPGHENINDVNDLLGDAYLRTNDYEEAIAHIENLDTRSERINKAYQRVTFHRAVELFNQEDFIKAIQLFNKSLQHTYDPKLAMYANYWCGEAYSIGRNYEKAINYYEKVFDYPDVQDPENFRIKTHYGIGYAHYNLQHYQKALPYFKSYINKSFALNNEKNKHDALLRLADCYYATKQYQDAIIYYNKALKAETPDQDYGHFQKGVVLGITDELEKAISELRKVTQNHPKSQYMDDALFNIGLLSMKSGKYNKAIIAFSDLLKNHEKSSYVPHALQKRALANYNLKRYDAAISDYKSILKDYPDHQVAESSILGLQDALSNAGRSNEFDAILARYKKSNPDDENVEYLQFESAKTQYFDLKYENAIKKFEAFISEYPESNYQDEANFYLADAYQKTGHEEKAFKHYKYVLKKGKKSAFIRKSAQRLGTIAFNSRQYRDAVKYYQNLTEIAANKRELFSAWSGLVKAYYKLEKYDSTAHYAKMLIETGSANVSNVNLSSLYLGKAAYQKGNTEEAKDQFINTINKAKDQYGAEAQYLLAKIQYEQGKHEASLETLFDLNAKFNNYEEWVGKSFLLIAENYIAKDEVFQAKATLNSLIDNFPLDSVKAKAKAKKQELEAEEQNQEQPVDTLESG